MSGKHSFLPDVLLVLASVVIGLAAAAVGLAAFGARIRKKSRTVGTILIAIAMTGAAALSGGLVLNFLGA